MLTRRGFIGHMGAGFLVAASGCRPKNLPDQFFWSDIDSDVESSLESRARIAARKNLFLGYPINMATPPEEFFFWRKRLSEVGIGSFAYNNVGDPFKGSCMPYNTHNYERAVITRFGKLFGFSANDIWGFVSNSGTDSNMHGMYIGRTILKERSGVNPKAYFTDEAHYSVQILQDLLGLERVIVGTLADGSMDPEDLRQKLAENSNHPALVVATVGTTFKGAIDSVDRIRNALQGHSSYLHVDAALFGGYLPYTDHGAEVRNRSSSGAAMTRYDSIAVSCHKFFGFPAPAGLFLTTKRIFDEFMGGFGRVHNPEYLRQIPGTITCSRDAVKPAEFYFFSTASATARHTEAADSILQNTSYLLNEMRTSFPNMRPTRADDRSNIIYFRRPAPEIVRKYSLATMQCQENRSIRQYAHVVIMPHVNREAIAEFLTDLAKYPSASV